MSPFAYLIRDLIPGGHHPFEARNRKVNTVEIVTGYNSFKYSMQVDLRSAYNMYSVDYIMETYIGKLQEI